jgi:integral membrane protein
MDFFTDREAWSVFRFAAISEAVGWSLLISGIALKRYVLHGNNAAVEIAGQIHGIIFLSYIVAVLAVCRSLRWSPKKTIVAGLASVPPYGTLVFEQWAAHKRRQAALKDRRQLIVRAVIVKGDTLLAVQPRDVGYWCLPGGPVKAGEDAETALARLITDCTGIMPSVKGLLYMFQYRHRSVERLELFFAVANSQDYVKLKPKTVHARAPQYAEAAFVVPDSGIELEPGFLRDGQVFKHAKAQRIASRFLHE